MEREFVNEQWRLTRSLPRRIIASDDISSEVTNTHRNITRDSSPRDILSDLEFAARDVMRPRPNSENNYNYTINSIGC